MSEHVKTIDLHGFSVPDAVDVVSARVDSFRAQQRDTELRLITGCGAGHPRRSVSHQVGRHSILLVDADRLLSEREPRGSLRAPATRSRPRSTLEMMLFSPIGIHSSV